MPTPTQILWGKYGGFEGPFYPGTIKYSIQPNAPEGEKRLRVITATEGGTFDSVNMYDSCIISVGLIQWCESKYNLTSRLLDYVIKKAGQEPVLIALQPALDYCCAELKQNASKQWRFHFKDSRGEVKTPEMQRELFLGCDGKVGSWTPQAKIRAKLWASCMANIWKNESARAAQVTYTVQWLTSFVMQDVKSIIFDAEKDEGLVGATRAAFLSFAANNPLNAAKHLKIATEASKGTKWSEEWCVDVLRELTFGPGTKIYPGRYDKIRPILESLWGVKLPIDSTSLKNWSVVKPIHENSVQNEPETVTQVIKEQVPTVEEEQQPTPVIAEKEQKSSSELVVRRPGINVIDYLLNFVKLIFALLKKVKG